MEILVQIIVLAFLVEAVVDTLKLLYENGEIQVNKIMAIVVGLIIAFTTKKDLLIIIKINEVASIIGIALTGILISRGGNFVHELFSKIGVEKNNG